MYLTVTIRFKNYETRFLIRCFICYHIFINSSSHFCVISLNLFSIFQKKTGPPKRSCPFLNSLTFSFQYALATALESNLEFGPQSTCLHVRSLKILQVIPFNTCYHAFCQRIVTSYFITPEAAFVRDGAVHGMSYESSVRPCKQR